MNTFQQVGALVPLVRYDPRFARAIGRWVLNAANASRLFYGNYLPEINQDSRSWSRRYDASSLIAHEGLKQTGPGTVSPYATGDAIGGGWAPTNLSLYSSSHVGILGAIIDTTDVRGILKLDLLATDYFHALAYPSFLFYNPDTIPRVVQVSVGSGTHDVYDAATKQFLLRGVSGTAGLTVSPLHAVVAVLVPSEGVISYDEEKMLVNGVVVDFHSGKIPPNHRPRIRGIGAAPASVPPGETTQLYCTSTDRDGEALRHDWFPRGGTLSGTGPVVTWTSPPGRGTFVITCRISDGKGGADVDSVTVSVDDSAVPP
jgi:hypothetical protein